MGGANLTLRQFAEGLLFNARHRLAEGPENLKMFGVFLRNPRICALGVLRRRLEFVFLLTESGAPFHGDRLLQRLICANLRFFSIGTFVETGTFRGDSLKWVAKKFPNCTSISIETNELYLQYSTTNVRGQGNAHVVFGNSGDVLRKLGESGLFASPVLFWLDAHWYRDWPLLSELDAILKFAPKAVIIIDDFKVPERPAFGFDRYGGEENSLEHLESHGFPLTSDAGDVKLLFPQYEAGDAFSSSRENMALRGYVMIYVNFGEGFSEFVAKHPDLLAKFINRGSTRVRRQDPS